MSKSEPALVSVRKTGSAHHPWEARCRVHRGEEIYIHPVFGVVAFGTRGIGNRLWHFAQYAADQHVKRSHS